MQIHIQPEGYNVLFVNIVQECHYINKDLWIISFVVRTQIRSLIYSVTSSTVLEVERIHSTLHAWRWVAHVFLTRLFFRPWRSICICMLKQFEGANNLEGLTCNPHFVLWTVSAQRRSLSSPSQLGRVLAALLSRMLNREQTLPNSRCR